MCCGQIDKKVIIPQRQVIPDPPIAPPVVQVQVVNNNVNSQRAAHVLRNNYHKLRFGNGG